MSPYIEAEGRIVAMVKALRPQIDLDNVTSRLANYERAGIPSEDVMHYDNEAKERAKLWRKAFAVAGYVGQRVAAIGFVIGGTYLVGCASARAATADIDGGSHGWAFGAAVLIAIPLLIAFCACLPGDDRPDHEAPGPERKHDPERIMRETGQ